MKKYLISAAVLASLASGAEATTKNFSGFYMGANLGYGFGSTTALTNGTGAVASTVSQKNNLSIKGFKGGLHLGYGWMLQRVFYVGLEAYGKLSNMEGNQQVKPGVTVGLTPNSTWKAKHTNSFGAALRLGGMINSMLAYVKVGVESASWKFEQSHAREALGGAVGNVSIGDSKTRRLTGIPLGLGMETMLTDRLILGGEFVYTPYTGSSTVTSSLTTAGVQQSISTQYRPKTTEFNVRLSYKW